MCYKSKIHEQESQRYSTMDIGKRIFDALNQSDMTFSYLVRALSFVIWESEGNGNDVRRWFQRKQITKTDDDIRMQRVNNETFCKVGEYALSYVANMYVIAYLLHVSPSYLATGESSKKAPFYETVDSVEKIMNAYNFGINLRKYRNKNEWSMVQLAEKIGVAPSTICELEKVERTFPTIGYPLFNKIAKMLDITEEQLLFD